MEREPVSSSSISSIGYDADTETLEIEFNTGLVYQFYGVPEDVHAEILEAPSIGAYFNAYIRPAYEYTRL